MHTRNRIYQTVKMTKRFPKTDIFLLLLFRVYLISWVLKTDMIWRHCLRILFRGLFLSKAESCITNTLGYDETQISRLLIFLFSIRRVLETLSIPVFIVFIHTWCSKLSYEYQGRRSNTKGYDETAVTTFEVSFQYMDNFGDNINPYIHSSYLYLM